MSDDFSIRENQKKRSEQGETPVGLDSLSADERGETAWALLEDEVSGQNQEKESRSGSEEAPAFPPMPGFGDDEEEPSRPSSIDIVRLLIGVWSRRNLVVMITAVVVILFGTLAYTMLHHSWTARVVLLKREHIDQFQVGKFGTPFKQQKYSMKTMLDTLKLPSVLSETISKSGLNVLPRDLSRQIGVVLGKESDIFQITVLWDNPKIAAAIANNLADSFLERNLNMRRSDAREVFEYYSEQLNNSSSKLQTIDAAVLEFQEKNGVVNFDSQTEVMLVKIADLEVDFRTMQAELAVDEQAIERLNETLSETPELIVQSSYYRNPLKKKMGELEWALEQARGRYTDKNPKVVDLIDQIEKLQLLIDSGKDEATPENTYAANPIKQELELKRYRLEDEIRLKKARVESLKNSIAISTSKLSSMTGLQKEFFHLTAEQGSIKGVLDNLRNRVEEAKVIMLSGQGDFDIVERARVPDEPESSGRKLLVVAGVILGGGFGLFVALLLEFLSPLIRTRREVAGITETELVFEFQQVPEDEQQVIDIKEPGETVAVVFRRIVNDILAQLSEKELQSLAFVSSERNSGRSLVVTNMAQTLSLKESSCLLIDADLASGAGTRLSDYFELGKALPGLLDVLADHCRASSATTATETRGVHIMPASSSDISDPHANSHLGSRRMAALISRLRAFGGYVFYDLPPLSQYETAYEAAAEIGHAIVVARSGVSNKKDVRAMAERLRASGVEIHAVILTDVPRSLMQGKVQYDATAKKRNLFKWKKA